MKTPQHSRPRTFTEVQYAFTRYIRDPENQPAPAGVDVRRLNIYRDLVYNNIERMLRNLFPVLRKITPDDRWHAMIRDFLKNHKSRTPLFPKVTQEFLKYLENERNAGDDPPFILELAHYEWVEYAVSIDPREISWKGVDPEGDLLEGRPVLCPLAWPLSYRYPVHTIRPDSQPEEAPPQPTYLIVYRNRHDKVGFMELNAVSARLVEQIRKNGRKSGRKILTRIAAELRHPNPDVVIAGGLETMRDLLARDVLLGTSKK